MPTTVVFPLVPVTAIILLLTVVLFDDKNAVAQKLISLRNPHSGPPLFQGQSVALLCLGDISLFASSSNILRVMKNNYPEIITYTVPGISSISAAAASTNFDLVRKGETLIIRECPSSESELTSLIIQSKEQKIVLVLLKIGKRWHFVKEIIKKEGIIKKCLIALNVGMSNQVIKHALNYNSDDMPYFSLLLIRF